MAEAAAALEAADQLRAQAQTLANEGRVPSTQSASPALLVAAARAAALARWRHLRVRNILE